MEPYLFHPMKINMGKHIKEVRKRVGKRMDQLIEITYLF